MNIKINILSFIAVATIASCNNAVPAKGKAQQQIQNDSTRTQVAEMHQCPMDCEKGKTYEKPGKCPVCEMEMQKKKK